MLLFILLVIFLLLQHKTISIRRSIRPYTFSYNCNAKGRWVNTQIIDVLMNEFNGYSRNYWVKAIQLDLVKVNGRTVDTSYKFKDRDVLSHITHRHEPVVNGDIEMIEDNDEFILVNKPAQLPVHPGGSYRFNSLTEILAKELILLNKTELHLVHRLDRLTSGLVLLAKSKQFANEMCQLIKDRKLKKTYLARVEGVFPNNMTNIPQLSLEQVLDNDVNNNKVFGYRNLTDTSGVSVLYLRCPIGLVDSKSGRYECNANDSKFAISSFQLVSYCNQTNTSLLQCGLITGRSQQLRLHLQFLGNPICNDFEYGGTIRYDEEKLSQLIASVRDYGYFPLTRLPGLFEYIQSHNKSNLPIDYDKFTTSDELMYGSCCYCNMKEAYELEMSLQSEGIHLHAYKYEYPNRWSYETTWPIWAKSFQ